MSSQWRVCSWTFDFLPVLDFLNPFLVLVLVLVLVPVSTDVDVAGMLRMFAAV